MPADTAAAELIDVLLIEDDDSVRLAAAQSLQLAGLRVQALDSATQQNAALVEQSAAADKLREGIEHFASTLSHIGDELPAAWIAVRQAIEFLVTMKGLSRDDAYMLTSTACDVAVTQLVDGNVGVHVMIPKAIFTAR